MSELGNTLRFNAGLMHDFSVIEAISSEVGKRIGWPDFSESSCA